jgi:hypothetical protein
MWIAVSNSTWRGDTALEERQALNTDPEVPLDMLDRPKRHQELVRIYERIKQLLATP